MTAELHGRVRALFAEALELPEAERLEFLQSACSGEPEVLPTVLRLLEAHRGCQSFLEDDARPTHRIGRYLVTGELGRGAMGVVYEAIDPLIGRKVAVKVIRLQALTDAGEAQLLRERLYREARSAGALSHSGIVVIFDVGQEGDLAFIAMELVEGVSLYQVLASGRGIPLTEALDILRQAAAALDYAHGNGVVHRDIKPANIMMDKGVKVKIADFGIAKLTSSDLLTQTGAVMGTPSYMSPEQIEALPPDGRSDQFSLAVVAYELLTGGRPFQAASLATLAHMIVYADRPSARAANPELPPAVDVVLRRSLARLPHDRYPSCTQFVAALEAASKDAGLPQPNVEVPAGHGQKGWRGLSRRRRILAAVGGAAVLALLDGFLLYKALAPKRPQAPTQLAEKRSAPSVAQPAVRPKSKAAAAPQPKDHKPKPEGVSNAPNPVPTPAAPGTTEAGSVNRVGNGVSVPSILTRVQPEYSEAARQLHVEGTVLLSMVIQPDGTAQDFRVLTSLGHGLDEKAIEAVRKWRFKPSVKDGNAVSVEARVSVAFRLGPAPGGASTWTSSALSFAPEAGLAPPAVLNGTMPKPTGDASDESVVLEFTVGPNGTVSNIYVIHGAESASQLLTSSLATWTFRPAQKGNRTVAATGRVLFIKGQGDEAAKLFLWPPRSPGNSFETGPAASSKGVNLTPLNPATVDDSSHSIDSKTPAVIEFVNHSGRAVDIYWLNPNGNRMLFYAGLAAGKTWFEGTYLTHPWLVVASGTGGTTARDSGLRLAGFEAVTPNSTRDPAKRDTAIITSGNPRPGAASLAPK
jgi:TonB family protein